MWKLQTNGRFFKRIWTFWKVLKRHFALFAIRKHLKMFVFTKVNNFSAFYPLFPFCYAGNRGHRVSKSILKEEAFFLLESFIDFSRVFFVTCVKVEVVS